MWSLLYAGIYSCSCPCYWQCWQMYVSSLFVYAYALFICYCLLHVHKECYLICQWSFLTYVISSFVSSQHQSISFPTYLARSHYHNRLPWSTFIISSFGLHALTYWLFLTSLLSSTDHLLFSPSSFFVNTLCLAPQVLSCHVMLHVSINS